MKTHLGAVGGGELSLKHTHTAVRAFIVKAKEELEGQRGVEKLCVSDRRAGGRREIENREGEGRESERVERGEREFEVHDDDGERARGRRERHIISQSADDCRFCQNLTREGKPFCRSLKDDSSTVQQVFCWWALGAAQYINSLLLVLLGMAQCNHSLFLVYTRNWP